MRSISLFLALAVCATWAHAQTPGPGYYRVDGVAADDVLNVRPQPGTGSPRIGWLAHDAGPIEVVEVREARGSSWGMIAFGESAGWVSMRYLAPVEQEGVLGTSVPAAARCGGTEPFWGMRFDGAAAVLSEPRIEIEETRLPIASAAPAAGRHYPILLSFAEGRGHALLDRGSCSDGMSDIPHGWSVSLILEEDGATRLLTGCCRVLAD